MNRFGFQHALSMPDLALRDFFPSWGIIYMLPLAMVLLLGVGCDSSGSSRSERQRSKGKDLDPTAEVFSTGRVHELRLSITQSNIDKLQRDERPYVRASLIESAGSTFPRIGIKLKGSAGSFQGFDGKPGFTINMDKYEKGVRFHSLDKFHLNNSVQDETYLNEWLGSEIFRRAGYPAPRVAHATVTINDRSPQLYILREGYDTIFIRRFFKSSKGNLYDGGFVQDLDAELEKDCGEGVDDHSDLRAISERLGSEDFQERVNGVSALIDLDQFLTFFALERMVAHWDGYCNNANNYRLYFDPESKRAVFLPHGMDQIFGDMGMPLFEPNGALVARVVMSSDKLRSQYRDKVRELLPIFNPPDSLIDAIDAKSAELQEIAGVFGEEFREQHRHQVNDLKQRVRERAANIVAQLEEEIPAPLDIPLLGFVPLDPWYPGTDHDQITASISGEDTSDEVLDVNFCGGQPGMGAWRCPVLLARGRYRLHGRFRVAELQPLDSENLETIVYGTQRDERWLRWDGDLNWQEIAMEIKVVEDRVGIEFLVGIRGAAGKLEVDKKSLRLERLE
ncbi:MAG: hypothetical protein FJ308_04015 [Planctomycetes bacterium]|nr:hypothetical protein [Planctomycetota bacterium]